MFGSGGLKRKRFNFDCSALQEEEEEEKKKKVLSLIFYIPYFIIQGKVISIIGVIYKTENWFLLGM